MSLVITLHDADVGIAVSEGRACIKGPEGQRMPFAEDRIKTGYLPDGSILGLTGDLVVTEPLRAAIEYQAATHTFSEVIDAVVPELVAEYRAKYPDNIFGVTIMGNDDGRIRSRTWNDRGDNSSLEGDTISTSTLGCDSTTHDEAAAAVRNYLVGMRKDYLNVYEAQEALKNIICDLAQRHPEINDRLHFSYVIAPGELQGQEDLKPLGDGCVTRKKGVCDFDLLMSQGADMTSRHVLTSNAAIPSWRPSSGDWQSDGTTNIQAIPGLGWTAQSSGAGDTYNVTATIDIHNGGILYLFADGNTAADYSHQVQLPLVGGSTYAPVVIFGTITGLSPGTHTIQFYVKPGTDQSTGQPLIVSVYSNWATLQRIY